MNFARRRAAAGTAGAFRAICTWVSPGPGRVPFPPARPQAYSIEIPVRANAPSENNLTFTGPTCYAAPVAPLERARELYLRPRRLRSMICRISGVNISCIANSILPPGQTSVLGRDMNESFSIAVR